MTTQRPDRFRLRMTFLATLILSVFSVLTLRLWFLQVLAYENYAAEAENNQVRLVPVSPPRGLIVDRDGEVLVDNRPTMSVGIRLDQLTDREVTLARLAEVLRMPVKRIEERLADVRSLPYAVKTIVTDVDEETIVYLREHRIDFPGVVTETRPVREYPKGILAAHLLGYVGEITSEQLKDPRYEGVRQGSIVGRSGLEYAYETYLRGTEGIEKLEIDSSGRTRRSLGRQDPTIGNTLVTSIDLELQEALEESLQGGIAKARTIYNREFGATYKAPAGGAVLIDPRNGEILAMASSPSYDPNSFVGGISVDEYRVLSENPAKPLLNRVIQAPFPPGSTFKVVTASAALQEGVAQRNGHYPCSVTFRYADTTFRNWRSVDSGSISVPQALVESCNTVFYRFGASFYERFRSGQRQRLQDYARAFGLGKRTGVDLGTPFEQEGLIPDEQWLHQMHAAAPEAFPYDTWFPGYTINMAIGQGDVRVTPLQLANVYASIANGGTLNRPHVGLRVMDGDDVVKEINPAPIGEIPVSDANLALIRSGLRQVPTRGTGRSSFLGFPLERIPVAAKTGTAELQTVPPKLPYAWFVAYAPADNPRYLVVVMLEEAGHGSESAAPIARRILEAAFDLPLSTLEPAARVD